MKLSRGEGVSQGGKSVGDLGRGFSWVEKLLGTVMGEGSRQEGRGFFMM